MHVPDTLRRAGFGKLAYQCWHRPTGFLRSVVKAGGPWEMRRTKRGQEEMELAARTLRPTVGTGAPLQLHLLTGRRFWFQTAFCLWTFQRHALRPVAPVIYDDGTLTSEYRDLLWRIFPLARFISQSEILARLNQHLPQHQFPTLRDRWIHYPNIRKLLDVHVGQSSWKLVVDSDLLFFAAPEFLVRWLDHGDRPLHAVDCETSYGYSRELMDSVAGRPVSELINVGLTGLRSEQLDWAQLEYWTKKLQAAEGTSYYLEQALVAMIVAGQPCSVAPAADYVTLPKGDESRNCRAVMHHYVANSKAAYFQRCWKIAMQP
jgi:hypothetical protein